MSETMQTVRKVEAAPGLVLEDVPVPKIAENEVLVEVEAASVCGTDLHMQDHPAPDGPNARRRGGAG